MVQQTRDMRRKEAVSDQQRRSRHVIRFQESGAGFHEHGDTAEKHRQRTAAIEHLSAFYESTCCDKRLLSLPGERWQLEQEMCRRYRTLRVVGFESCPVTFERSMGWMPRRKTMRGTRSPLILAFDTGFGRLRCADTYTARAINADIRLAFMREPLISPTKRMTSNWLVKDFTTFWLDSFSPLGSEVGFSMCRLIAQKAHPIHGAAFALAFTIGRDDTKLASIIASSGKATPLEQRAETVKHLIETLGRGCEIDSSMSHDSWNADSNLKIGTVFGRVLPQVRE